MPDRRWRLCDRNLHTRCHEIWTERIDDLDLGGEQQRATLPLTQAREEFTRSYILQVLERNGGNRTRAAKELGVDPRTVFRYLERDPDAPEPGGLGGTYAGNVVATAAACATMDELEAGALDKVNAHGTRLMNGFNQVLMQVYAHSCRWSVGQRSRIVPPPRFPWGGT